MPHGNHCLWKKHYLSAKLKRAVTFAEVHVLCDYLGFTDPNDTIAWIEKASAEEIEAKLREAKKKKKKKVQDEEYVYVYAS